MFQHKHDVGISRGNNVRKECKENTFINTIGVFAQTTACVLQKNYHNIGFWGKRQIFYRQKSQKIVIITSTPVDYVTRIIGIISKLITKKVRVWVLAAGRNYQLLFAIISDLLMKKNYLLINN
jgi:hypothetical protein